MKITFKNFLYVFLTSILYTSSVTGNAATPLLTFTPQTPTAVIVSADSQATVNYTVTNQSQKTHTWVLSSTPGISQNTGIAGQCGSSFTLQYQQSCTLSLQISANQLNGSFTGGPVACDQGNSLLCYQPSLDSQLSVTVQTQRFLIGGNVSGLNAGNGITLQNNGTDNLVVDGNGQFQFSTSLDTGANYNVTILNQPQGQFCNIANASGTVGTSNVNNILVQCSSLYTVGGTLAQLGQNKSVTLNLNIGSSDVTLTSNGPFTFPGSFNSGAIYQITVAAQPSGQICTVQNGTGLIGNNNVNDISVTCNDVIVDYSIGGNVTQLGQFPVTISDGVDSLTINVASPFTFPTRLPTGSIYQVTVTTPPLGQTCTVTNGQGIVANSDITNIIVSCQNTPLQSFTVGGNLSGLGTGQNIVLLNNSGDPLTLNTNGSFTFSNPIPIGSSYNVTIQSQPSNQFCQVINGSAPNILSDVTSVSVQCRNIPEYGYVVQSNSVSVCGFNANSGTLFACAISGAQGVSNAVSMATNASKTKAYILNNSGQINSCDIQSTGDLFNCQIAATIPGISNAYFITVNPSSPYAYITASEGIFSCNIDATTGAISACSGPIATTGVSINNPLSVAFNGIGTRAYINNSSEIYTCQINTNNGSFLACSSIYTPALGTSLTGNVTVSAGLAAAYTIYSSQVNSCTMFLGGIVSCSDSLTSISNYNSTTMSPNDNFVFIASSNGINSCTLNNNKTINACSTTASGIPSGLQVVF